MWRHSPTRSRSSGSRSWGRRAVAGTRVACGALLGDRVIGAVTLAGIAPVTDDFDWSAGMVDAAAYAPPSRAARRGPGSPRPRSSIPTAPSRPTGRRSPGAWESLGDDAQRAGTEFTDGLIDDDVAIAAPWGFDPAAVEAPVLIVQGGEDRVVPPSHADWLVRPVPAGGAVAAPARRPRLGPRRDPGGDGLAASGGLELAAVARRGLHSHPHHQRHPGAEGGAGEGCQASGAA